MSSRMTFVGKQMDPELFLVHLRRLAVQHDHASGGLEVALIEQRGDQHLVGDLEFTDSEFIRQARVLHGRHPLWAGRLGPARQVIARAQRLAAAKVGDKRAVLLEQHIHTCANQTGDQELIAVQGIGKHHVARAETFK